MRSAVSTADPRLLLVDWQRQFNIVLWEDRYFGVPRRLGEVDLRVASRAAIPGLLEADTYQNLQALLKELPPDNGPPTLVEQRGSYNVVVWRGRFYGLEESLGAVDLEAGERPDKDLLEADTLEELRNAISVVERTAPPRTLSDFAAYNLVRWNGRFFGIPKRLGHIDVTKPDTASILDVMQAATIDDLKVNIQQRSASF